MRGLTLAAGKEKLGEGKILGVEDGNDCKYTMLEETRRQGFSHGH